MKKTLSYSTLVALLITFLWPSIGAAIDTNQSGRIIDEFKDRQKDILFEKAPFGASGANDIIAHEYNMRGLEALKEKLKLQTDLYQQKKAVTTAERVTLESVIQNIDASIATTEKSITDTQSQIQLKQQQIQELQTQTLALKIKIQQHRKVILSYLANLYSEGNLIFDESNDVDLIKGMILTGDDTDFALSDITYKTLVMQMGQKFVGEYRDMIREYYVMGVQVQEEQGHLSDLKTTLESQQRDLESQKSEKEKLLEITKGQEALYIQYIAAQEQAQSQIETEWQKQNNEYQKSFDELLVSHGCNKAKKEAQATAECIRLRQFFINETELAKTNFVEGTPNILDWPIESRKIATYFRDPGYYSFLHSQHDAIDIATPQSTDVHAVADGYVYYIVPPVTGGYSYMAVRHRDGYVTVYGHLSEIKATKYQFVRRGDVIAKSGGDPSTPGAGPMTTGAHLHFEVWKDKEPVDPLRYMTLVDIDYTTLPSIYQDKFIDDIVEKGGENADISAYKKKFSIEGNSETDRQKYLLKKYATKDFQNWQMWVDTGVGGKIDPSFLMCVGLAETTLGNHLKTSYNIGNIGNTDDGGTYDFASPTEGISWMTKTLNNKYLGQYTDVSQLSRWGNTDGPIYASSSASWHNNVIRCLSALKGRAIDDHYEFRIK